MPESNRIPKAGGIFLGIPSLVGIVFDLVKLSTNLEAVLFSERVVREYYLEYSMPGETVFIYFGLLLNALYQLRVFHHHPFSGRRVNRLFSVDEAGMIIYSAE